MRSPTVRRGIRTVAVLATLTLAGAACSDESAAPPSTGGNPFFAATEAGAPVSLVADRSCDAVLEGFQSFAPAVLSDQLVGVTDDMAFEAGTTVASGAASAGAGGELDAAAPVPDAQRSAEGEAADGSGGTSTTNTQEAGIDEPDVVETDGDHVYLVDGEDLVVLDGGTAELVSRTRLASWGAQLLLQGDRLLVVAGGMSYGMPMPIEDGAATGIAADPAPPASEEPQQTEPQPAEPQPTEPQPIPVEPQPIPVEPPSFQPGTVLQLLDVSDPAAPQVVQTTELEGSHVTTRVVDGVARVVISSWPDVQPMVADVVAGGGVSSSRRAVAEVQEELAASVADTEVGDWLPAFRTTVAPDGEAASEEGTLVECEDVLLPEVNAGLTETSILRVDLEEGFDPADTTTIVAEAGTVYASASTLYVAANRFVPVQEQGQVVAEELSTALHAFDLGGDGPAAHVGAGEVPGHVLNQYSLSEHDGHLRVATTEGAPWSGGGEPSQSGVRVLHLEGDRLVEVGAITGLGLTETIQSVRFMGPVGYVVTFRQTDPLYVIDLSDPAAPRAVGELKIPGFSSYLHPVGEGRLVGVGRDADLDGQDRGLLVSLFDVSDPTAPRQVQTWTQRDAYSMAGEDPKAFLHWAPESAVAVPIERYGAFDSDGREIAPPQAGIVVLDVDDSGITERGTVTADGRYPSRALVVDGRLWSLFDGGVVVSEFAEPAAGSFHPYR